MKTYALMRESLIAKAAQLGGNDWTAEAVGGHDGILCHTYMHTFLHIQFKCIVNVLFYVYATG